MKPMIGKPPAGPSPLVQEFKGLDETLRKLLRELLDNGIGDTGVAQTRDALMAHAQFYERCTGNRSLPAPDRVELDYMRRQTGEFIEGYVLQEICGYVLQRAPVPVAEASGGSGDFITGVTLFRLVCGAVSAWGFKRNSKDIRTGLADNLLANINGFAGLIKRRLQDEGIPNLQGISGYLMNMEIILWALDDMQAQGHATQGRSQVKVLARMALRRVCELIDRHTGKIRQAVDRDFLKLFQCLDDLIFITQKILDGEAAERDIAKGSMVEYLGKQLVDRFIKKMQTLIEAGLAATREKLIADPTAEVDLDTQLGHIENLHKFGILVAHEEAPESLDQTAESMRKDTVELALGLGRAMKQALAAGHRAQAQAMMVHVEKTVKFMAAQGWGKDVDQIRAVLAGGGAKPAAGTSPQGGGADDIRQKLSLLSALLTQGRITKADYDKKRQELLMRL